MNTPTIANALTRAIDAALRRVNTMIPARVESYDRAKQTITAQPLIPIAYLDESGARVTEKLPAVTSVPVLCFGGGGTSIAPPLRKGDTVLLCFAQAAIDKWLDQGGLGDPIFDRRFDLSDAMAIPGLRPRTAALGSDATHATDMVIAGGLRLGGSGGVEPTLMANAFKTALDTLISAIGSAVGSSGTPAGATAAGTAITTAKAAFDTAMTAAMTTLVKVK